MRYCGSCSLLCLLCLGLLPLFAVRAAECSSTEPHTIAAPATTLEAALRSLADRADVIFSGEVVAVEPTAAAVEVRWRVERAVRGTVAGQTFTLREWAGLWQGNPQRYVKGQRALLLLQAASVAGYASPVGGSDGVITLHGDADSGTLDLDLLQQRVLVKDEARLRPALALQAAGGSLAASDALQRNASLASLERQARFPRTVSGLARSQVVQLVDNGRVAATSGNGPRVSAAPAAQIVKSVDANLVLGMLQAWQRQRGTGVAQ